MIYLAGRFSHFGPARPFGAAFDATTGAVLPNYARPDAPVTSVIPDGEGGWFIAGGFHHVDGQQRYGIARLNSDGSLRAWRVNTPDDDNAEVDVRCMLLRAGVLYLGGGFQNIGGVPRRYLAAVDVGSGALLSSDYAIGSSLGGYVGGFGIHGDVLYFGGKFTSVGGQPRSNLAGVDLSTGLLTSFDVAVTGGASRPILALKIHNDVLYVGGAFNTIGGVDRRGIAGVVLATYEVTGLDPSITGGADVYAIGAYGDTLYIGGDFQQVGGQYRRGIAAFDIQTNALLPWDLHLEGHSTVPGAWYTRMNAMIVDGDEMIVAGDFTSLGSDLERPFLARVDRVSAAVHDWQPAPDQAVRCVARSGNVVYAGGDFTSILHEGVRRSKLAAIDPATGRPTDWAPDPGDFASIFTLVPTEDRVFVGGSISWMDDGPIDNILAYDKVTGQRLPWYPNAGTVNSLARHGNNVILGLENGTVALLDVNDATLSPWSAQLGTTSNYIREVLPHDGALYVRGSFQQVNGQPRNRLAAFDLATGELLPWAPDPDEEIRSMAIHDGSMFLTGDFDEVGGVEREVIARVDLGAGNEINSWDAPGQSIQMFYSVHSHDDVLYGGGWVTNFGDAPDVQNLIAIDPQTGSLLEWRPYALGVVNAITSMDSLILIGGAGGLDEFGTPFFGAFEATLPVSVAPVGSRLDYFLAFPNPTNGIVHVQAPRTVKRFRVCDVSGRIIHQSGVAPQIDLRQFSPGVYVLEYLDSEGRTVRSARLIKSKDP